MNILDIIIKIGSVIGALTLIFGLVCGAIKLAIKPLVKRFEKLERHSEQNYMGVLRLTIMSNEMPIGERIIAGQKYLDNDGNGEIKKFLEQKFNITKTVDTASHYKQ